MNDWHSTMKVSAGFARDKRGNFSIMTAICLPVLLGIGGASFEIARAMQVKADLQSMADSAVLSATTKARLAAGQMTEAQMIAAANGYIEASAFTSDLEKEKREEFLSGITLGASKQKTEKGEEFHVTSVINYAMPLSPLLKFIGHDMLNITVESNASSSVSMGAAISLYLVLDRSGSMSFKTDTIDKTKSSCKNYDDNNWAWKQTLKETKPCYVTKIASLKLAVNYLADAFKTSDPSFSASSTPSSKLIRTAAIAYNDTAFPPQPLEWGVAATIKHVAALPEMPEGGTSAINALTRAYNDLRRTNATEANKHKVVGNLSFDRHIVFMTDGQMTGASANWDPAIDNAVRKVCADAKQDGITVFTVAFMAPQKGQDLLKACATSQEHYYAPDKMTEIVAAFGEIARQATSKISKLTH